MTDHSPEPLLSIRDLTVKFRTDGGDVHAVTDVSYDLLPGKTLCVVGESGSGKSVHVLSILGLLPKPAAQVTSGRILFDGRDLLRLPDRALYDLRGQDIAMVFQNPMSSLNPVLRIETQITEILRRHGGVSGETARRRAVELLDRVRIPRAAERIRDYPHEFSGGQRQRIMIAMAIACRPRLLIADEATTALDVTTQAEIIALVRELKAEQEMSMIWITHDLGVVAGLADTVQVMYGGRVIERGPVDAIFDDPRNAYTLGLLNSLPDMAAAGHGRLRQIDGNPPDLRDPPPGDPFAPRNPYATERCWREMPPLVQAAGAAPGHLVAAWYDLPALRSAEGASR